MICLRQELGPLVIVLKSHFGMDVELSVHHMVRPCGKCHEHTALLEMARMALRATLFVEHDSRLQQCTGGGPETEGFDWRSK